MRGAFRGESGCFLLGLVYWLTCRDLPALSPRRNTFRAGTSDSKFKRGAQQNSNSHSSLGGLGLSLHSRHATATLENQHVRSPLLPPRHLASSNQRLIDRQCSDLARRKWLIGDGELALHKGWLCCSPRIHVGGPLLLPSLGFSLLIFSSGRSPLCTTNPARCHRRVLINIEDCMAQRCSD